MAEPTPKGDTLSHVSTEATLSGDRVQEKETETRAPALTPDAGVPVSAAKIYFDFAKNAADSFDKHRQYEWKMAFGYWTIILLSFHKDFQGIALPSYAWIISGVLFYLIWLRGIWVVNQNDKNRFDYFIARAQSEVGVITLYDVKSLDKISFRQKKWLFKFILDWSIGWQALVTVGLIYARIR